MSRLDSMGGYAAEGLSRIQSLITEALRSIDGARISDAYRAAMAAGDRAGAIAALAAYYRGRTACAIPAFGAGEYSREVAERGVRGQMREIGIPHDFPEGKIDFLFNPTLTNPPVNHEWLWQLNRHGWWSHMARAYAATGEERYAQAFNTQLLDFAAQTEIPDPWNAPGSAYRTIECGIRLMGSWQAAFQLFRASTEVWDETLVLMLGSFHRQSRHLLEHPTKGNWLLMETSGVYDVGSIFPEFTDAEHFRQLACARVIEEIGVQFLPDGLQYELSPDYHSVSLGCALNIYRTAMALGRTEEFPPAYLDSIRRMVMAAVQLSTPGFTQPRTNDCYTLRTRSFTGFAESMFPEEEVFAFVNSDRARGNPPKGKTASAYLPWSGFAAMRADWSGDAAYLCFDVGPLGMGHWHQDKLNIHLYKGGEELIFDDGGGQYERSAERSYGVSAFDHNTVTVDGLGQNRSGPKISEAEIDAGWITNDDFDYAFGVYEDTFGEGMRPATHKREVRFCKPSFFVVRDTLTSLDGKAHVYGLRFQLDTCTTKSLPGGAVVAEYGKEWDLLLAPIADAGESAGVFTAHSAQKDPLCGYFIGRNTERNHPATTLILESAPAKVHHFTTVLLPFRHGDALPQLTVLADGRIRVEYGEGIYLMDRTKLNEQAI